MINSNKNNGKNSAQYFIFNSPREVIFSVTVERNWKLLITGE